MLPFYLFGRSRLHLVEENQCSHPQVIVSERESVPSFGIAEQVEFGMHPSSFKMLLCGDTADFTIKAEHSGLRPTVT